MEDAILTNNGTRLFVNCTKREMAGHGGVYLSSHTWEAKTENL